MSTTLKSTGVVKRLVREKGFGFIRSGEGVEYFFHRSAVSDGRFDELAEGTRVNFSEDDGGHKGPRADHVELL